MQNRPMAAYVFTACMISVLAAPCHPSCPAAATAGPQYETESGAHGPHDELNAHSAHGAFTAQGPHAARESLEGLPIREIIYIGCDRLDRDLLSRTFGIAQGERFAAERVGKGLRRLEKLSAVEYASFDAYRRRDETSVKLRIIITEAPTMHIYPLVSRNVTNTWGFGVRFGERNLRQLDEKVSISLIARGGYASKLALRKPSFAVLPRIGVGLDVSYRDHRYPYPDYRGMLLDDRIRRLEASFSVHVAPFDLASVSVGAGVDRIDACGSLRPYGAYAGAVYSPSGTFTTLEVTVEINDLGDSVYPRRGGAVSVSRRDWGVFQKNPAMTNFRYRFGGSLFVPAGPLVCAFRSTGVFTHGNVPLALLEHLGGEGTIRGYEFGLFSGANSILGGAELRIPLNFDDVSEQGNPLVLVDFHLFADGGACWTKPESPDLGRFHSGFGCGMHFIPARNVLLTVDYAWHRRSNGRWQIDVGTRF